MHTCVQTFTTCISDFCAKVGDSHSGCILVGDQHISLAAKEWNNSTVLKLKIRLNIPCTASI